MKLPSEDFLLDLYSSDDHELSLIHYPPVAEAELKSRTTTRLLAHTNADAFTMLFQDDCGGLEVKHPSQPGEWLAAEPVEGALVMNIGDALGRWSNDWLRSTRHRVHFPPLDDRFEGTERITRKRYSMPFFVLPKPDTMMECFPACCDGENPAKYESERYGDWLEMRSQESFGTKD